MSSTLIMGVPSRTGVQLSCLRGRGSLKPSVYSATHHKSQESCAMHNAREDKRQIAGDDARVPLSFRNPAPLPPLAGLFIPKVVEITVRLQPVSRNVGPPAVGAEMSTPV